MIFFFCVCYVCSNGEKLLNFHVVGGKVVKKKMYALQIMFIIKNSLMYPLPTHLLGLNVFGKFSHYCLFVMFIMKINNIEKGVNINLLLIKFNAC